MLTLVPVVLCYSEPSVLFPTRRCPTRSRSDLPSLLARPLVHLPSGPGHNTQRRREWQHIDRPVSRAASWTIDLARQLPHPPGTAGILGDAEVDDFLTLVAPILATRTHRVQTLYIVAFYSRDLRNLLRALGPLSTSVLKGLHLEVICPRLLDDELPLEGEALPIFESESSVEKLALVNVPLLRAGVMFGRVVNLTLDWFPGDSWTVFSSNLREMSALETLTLWGPVCSDYDGDSVVWLPALKTLAVKIAGASDMPKALGMLRMPALVWLHIGRTQGRVEPVVNTLGDALDGVTRLELYSRPIQGGHKDDISIVWERAPKLSNDFFPGCVLVD
ncbi:hypothetical protein B0H16DRAFT_1739415 [Mycena metata]|uniref:Uncharacterized protein n=1 Tax=Mycena metata TaxID=1033252 RepID=A0AAD7HG32_9AGAR|nr:hypothetical protein B0H16DRAFT_1739415 [Mycena metata]